MNKNEIKEILTISKNRLSKGDVPKYSNNFDDNICALIYGIAEYRRIKELRCTWEDAAIIIGKIFNKEVTIHNTVIEKEILKIIPKHFSLDNLLLNMVMNNE